MLYSDWTEAVMALLEIPPTDPPTYGSTTPSTETSFNILIPRIIDYTENRLQRDLDFINTIVVDATGSLTANNRAFTLPTDVGTYVVVTEAALVISGVRQAAMLPVSKEFLDAVYPSNTAASTPSHPTIWCPYNGTQILVGPPPDTTYGIEITGTQRCTQLSSTNTSNFLTLNMPDMYIAASIVYIATYQRDYGISSDDPHLAPTWEQKYKDLLASASVEELRKKFQAQGWTARLPSPIATPPQK